MPVITLADLTRMFGEFQIRVTNLSVPMKAAGLMALSEVKDRIKRGVDPMGKPFAPLAHTRPQGGSLPLNNTGLLGNSFWFTSDSNSFRVGTNLQQANLLHHGGTVRPVKAQYLTIPATVEAIYAGSARRQGGLFPRINKAKTGGVLVDAQGRTQWYLTKEVTIPPRPMVGISPELETRIKRMLFTYLTTGKLF
jgi:phage gpG-like protein